MLSLTQRFPLHGAETLVSRHGFGKVFLLGEGYCRHWNSSHYTISVKLQVAVVSGVRDSHRKAETTGSGRGAPKARLAVQTGDAPAEPAQ